MISFREVSYDSNSRLFHLVSEQIWTPAILRVQSHPKEVCEQVILQACSINAPLKVLKAMLDVSPLMLSEERCANLMLETAISRRASNEVISYLIKTSNEATSLKKRQNDLLLAIKKGAPDEVVLTILKENCEVASIRNERNGLQPIHYALQKEFSLKVLYLLAKADPTAMLARVTLRYNRDKLILDQLWDEYKSTEDGAAILATVDSSFDDEGDFGKFWSKIAMILNIANYGQIHKSFCENPYDEILHSVIGYECCPSDIFNLTMKLHPDKAQIKDRNGNHPLHIAAESRILKKDGSGETTIQQLIKFYPKAAKMKNNEGRVPLNIALESGKGWDNGVQCILNAAPDALVVRDDKTHMYPFMTAASKNSLKATHQLLRANPQALIYAVSKELANILSAKKRQSSELSRYDRRDSNNRSLKHRKIEE